MRQVQPPGIAKTKVSAVTLIITWFVKKESVDTLTAKQDTKHCARNSDGKCKEKCENSGNNL